MPLIDIKVVKGVFTPEEKHELVKRVSETVIVLAGESLRPWTHVGIIETAYGEWAMDGKYYTAEDVKTLRAGTGLTRTTTR
jgi:4-oxalocrotonate tautomerase